MKFTAFLALAALALSTPAMAAPAYVECMFKQGDGSPWPVRITLDEPQGSVVVLTSNNGRATSMRGVFGPSDVRFGEGGVFYQLNRVTLEIVRETRIFGTFDKAKCVLLETPKRAF